MDGTAATDRAEQPVLIAFDWGTSSLRAWLLGPNGTVLAETQAAMGIMHLPEGGFAAAVAEVSGHWRRRWPELPLLACGMVGSAQGWLETPYLPCPADLEDLASSLVKVPSASLYIVPGVIKNEGVLDVMRGEETQVAGALNLRPELQRDARIVLPGTHSKWVGVAGGKIRGFETYLTGELFAVLGRRSILGRLAEGSEKPSAAEADAAFLRGVQAARAGGRAARLLFSVRSLALTGHLAHNLTLDYLSGVLIGDEIDCALGSGSAPAALIGSPELCRRYNLALSAFATEQPLNIEGATVSGLWRVAVEAALVPA